MFKFIGIDQYGGTTLIRDFPRKELLDKFGGPIDLMYVDTGTGPKRIGYVIKGLWIAIHQLKPWKD